MSRNSMHFAAIHNTNEAADERMDSAAIQNFQDFKRNF